MNYKQYIQSYKWKSKKKELFNKRGKECEQCGSVYRIQVHHLNYDNIGEENLEDLQILCYQCHMSKHDKYFKKYVLKAKTKKRRKRRKYRGKSKDEILLESDFKTLSVAQKRRYLKLKGYKL